jgi:chromosome segregation ATPase
MRGDSMTLGTAATPGDGGDSLSGNDRSALEGMLKSYSSEQLVDEVLVAWDELSARNDDLVSTKQRLRILELDLAEREDGVAPEIMMLQEAEEGLRERDARIVHIERMLEDSRVEIEEHDASASVEEMEVLGVENNQLRNLTEDQNGVISEMEGKVEQLVEALDRAAQAGLTSVTADEVRALKAQLDQRSGELEAESAANAALEEERQRLRDIADRLRGLLDQRDKRLGELEEQLERVLQGPRSVSAEHDYLVEQIEELKRRLLERNREYEALRRRERRLHNDVFERDERVSQMQLTMTDLEAALQDRTSELRELEKQFEQSSYELDASRRSERTREVVGRVFADSLELSRDHEKRQDKREEYAAAPDVERKITSPSLDDMTTLASGEEIELDVEETEIDTSDAIDVGDGRPHSPGGYADPGVYDDD